MTKLGIPAFYELVDWGISYSQAYIVYILVKFGDNIHSTYIFTVLRVRSTWYAFSFVDAIVLSDPKWFQNISDSLGICQNASRNWFNSFFIDPVSIKGGSVLCKYFRYSNCLKYGHICTFQPLLLRQFSWKLDVVSETCSHMYDTEAQRISWICSEYF